MSLKQNSLKKLPKTLDTYNIINIKLPLSVILRILSNHFGMEFIQEGLHCKIEDDFFYYKIY